MNLPDELAADPEIARGTGIHIVFSGQDYLSPNLTRHREWTWVNEAPEDDPNQGWEEYDEEE